MAVHALSIPRPVLGKAVMSHGDLAHELAVLRELQRNKVDVSIAISRVLREWEAQFSPEPVRQ